MLRLGSGKSHSVYHRIKYLEEKGRLPERTAILSFNRYIQQEWQSKDIPKHIHVCTAHSLGFRLLREVTSNNVGEVMPLKYQKCDWANLKFEEAKVLEKIRQKYILNAEDPSFLKDKIMEELVLNMNIADPEREDAIKIYNVWKKGIQRIGSVIDYQDMVTGVMEMLAKNSKFASNIKTKFDLVIIDEVQDFNKHFIKLVELIQPSNIIMAGDAFQCQPADTIVTKSIPKSKSKNTNYDLSMVRIEDIQVGDTLKAYSMSDSQFYKNRIVEDVSKIPYDDDLIKIKTSSGLSSSYTKNHICVANLRGLIDKYCIYIMMKGNKPRIGHTKIEGNANTKCNGLVTRALTEKADSLWILKIADNKLDAIMTEKLLQTKYGISGLMYVNPNENHPNGETFSQERLDKFWNQISISDYLPRAIKCLEDHGRDINYPIWESSTSLFKLKRPTLIRATNLMDGMLVAPERQKSLKKDEWEPITVWREHYKGDVYSLKVSHDELYIADGIVTHNCINMFNRSKSRQYTSLGKYV